MQSITNDRKVRLCLLRCHSRTQPANAEDGIAVPGRLWSQWEWSDNIDLVPRCKYRGKIERGRQNADHSVWRLMKRDGFADNGRVAAETPPPICVSEDHSSRTVERAFFRSEIPAV